MFVPIVISLYLLLLISFVSFAVSWLKRAETREEEMLTLKYQEVGLLQKQSGFDPYEAN